MNYNHPDLIKDWRSVCEHSDGCTSYFFKYLSAVLMWMLGASRNWCPCCKQHDFDFEFGPKYGITFEEANKTLRNCIDDTAAGKPLFHRWLRKRIADSMWVIVKGPIGRCIWDNYRRKCAAIHSA